MIDTIAVPSRSRANVTHTLYINEQGKAVGCSCEYREHHMWTPCPHMMAHAANEQSARESARGNYELSIGYNSIEGLY